MNGAARWKGLHFQQALDLASAPVGILPPQLQDFRLDLIIRSFRAVDGPPRPIFQSRLAPPLMTGPPLVERLFTNSQLLAHLAIGRFTRCDALQQLLTKGTL